MDGKLYISPILDCCNGEIVALEMRENMKKELCIDAVAQLSKKYGDLKGIILHSDRGSQYTSDAFRADWTFKHNRVGIYIKSNLNKTYC